MPLKIATPNKGRLMEDTIELLRSVGVRVPRNIDRTLIAPAGDGRYQVVYTRAQDIPEFVEAGATDVGITGLDLVEETGCRVERLLDLSYGRCKLVVAAPEQSRAQTLDDLPPNGRVATSYPNLAKRFFKKRRKRVRIVPISGAAEIAPHIGVADAIADLTQTGATLKQNHLVLLDVILDSWAVLIGSPQAGASRRQDIADLVEAVRSVQEASRRRYLMANVPNRALDKVTDLLPGLASPTVMKLAKGDASAIHAVVEENVLNTLVPKLRKAGASGILVLPIERMIP